MVLSIALSHLHSGIPNIGLSKERDLDSHPARDLIHRPTPIPTSTDSSFQTIEDFLKTEPCEFNLSFDWKRFAQSLKELPKRALIGSVRWFFSKLGL